MKDRFYFFDWKAVVVVFVALTSLFLILLFSLVLSVFCIISSNHPVYCHRCYQEEECHHIRFQIFPLRPQFHVRPDMFPGGILRLVCSSHLTLDEHHISNVFVICCYSEMMSLLCLHNKEKKVLNGNVSTVTA